MGPPTRGAATTGRETRGEPTPCHPPTHPSAHGTVNETGQIPPGNAPGETKWQAKKRAAAKAEIRLTPGKGIQDLTCKVEDLIDAVVKTNRVRGRAGLGNRLRVRAGLYNWVLGGWVTHRA